VKAFGPKGSDYSGRAHGLLRADLHVHSRYSGPGHLASAGGRAGVGEPLAIYHAARARGMDLVTLTDIDTIEGCLRLRDRLPDARDLVVSEEVTARDPRTGRFYHVLVWGLGEAQHREIAALRDDLRELAGYLRQERIAAGLGAGPDDAGAGIWSGPEGARVLGLFDRFEVKSGAHGRRHNEIAARLAQARGGRRLGITGGSCAHGPARVGRTCTVARAADTHGFLDELRAGRTWVAGDDGGVWGLAGDLSRSLVSGYRARPGTLLRLPVDLLRAPLRQGLRHARHAVHVRRAGRLLDLEDVVGFQERARTYGPGVSPRGRQAADLS
jgi:predicted metal-dependent phosphoesterase TrpH